jgi:hypothetical protein
MIKIGNFGNSSHLHLKVYSGKRGGNIKKVYLGFIIVKPGYGFRIYRT